MLSAGTLPPSRLIAVFFPVNVPREPKPRWYVALILDRLQPKLEEEIISNITVRLGQFKNVYVEELFLNTKDAPLSKIKMSRTSHSTPSFLHVQRELVKEEELMNIAPIAKAWLFPDGPLQYKSPPSFSLIEAGVVVETEYVKEIASRARECLSGQHYDDSNVIIVKQSIKSRGLTAALYRAAWDLACSDENLMVFIFQSHPNITVDWKQLDKHTDSHKVVVFVDAEASNEVPLPQLSKLK